MQNARMGGAAQSPSKVAEPNVPPRAPAPMRAYARSTRPRAYVCNTFLSEMIHESSFYSPFTLKYS